MTTAARGLTGASRSNPLRLKRRQAPDCVVCYTPVLFGMMRCCTWLLCRPSGSPERTAIHCNISPAVQNSSATAQPSQDSLQLTTLIRLRMIVGGLWSCGVELRGGKGLRPNGSSAPGLGEDTSESPWWYASLHSGPSSRLKTSVKVRGFSPPDTCRGVASSRRDDGETH